MMSNDSQADGTRQPNTTGSPSPASQLPVEKAVMASPCLASVGFMLHTAPMHQVTGHLVGSYEIVTTKSDSSSTDTTCRWAMISELNLSTDPLQDITSISSNTMSSTAATTGSAAGSTAAAPPLGRFILRRRSSHRLSWKEERFLRLGGRGAGVHLAPSSEGELLLLVTEEESETGLLSMHYTLFRQSHISGAGMKEIPLQITNLVATGGEYEALVTLRGRTVGSQAALPVGGGRGRTEQAIAADAKAMAEASLTLSRALEGTVTAVQDDLQRVRQDTEDHWRSVMAKNERIEQLKQSAVDLTKQIEALEEEEREREQRHEIEHHHHHGHGHSRVGSFPDLNSDSEPPSHGRSAAETEAVSLSA